MSEAPRRHGRLPGRAPRGRGAAAAIAVLAAALGGCAPESRHILAPDFAARSAAIVRVVPVVSDAQVYDLPALGAPGPSRLDLALVDCEGTLIFYERDDGEEGWRDLTLAHHLDVFLGRLVGHLAEATGRSRRGQ